MVELRLTVTMGSGDDGVDVVIRSPRESVVGQVRAALAGALGAPHAAALDWAVDGVQLPVGHRLGRPPLVRGALVTLVRPGTATRTAAGAEATVEAHVVAGPAAGARIEVRPGRVVVGRGEDADLRIDDPDVSRRHAELTLTSADTAGNAPQPATWQAVVRDLASTNGTRLLPAAQPGQPVEVGPVAQEWPRTATLRLGSSSVVLRPVEGQRADGAPALRPDGDGQLMVNRAPRITAATPDVAIEYPPPPATAAASRLPWPTILLPLLLAVPVAVLWHQPTFLLLALTSPLLALAQYLLDRRTRRGARVRDTAEQQRVCAARDGEVRAAVAAEVAREHREHPDLALIAAVAAGRGPRLWERRPSDDDALVLRLGLADLPSTHVAVRRDGELTRPTLQGVPVALDLAGAGVVGVCGPRHEREALARSLLGQAAVWHSPRELRVVVRSAEQPAGWAWTTWLPHADPDLPSPDSSGRRTLVVLDGAEQLRRQPAVADLLARGPEHGVLTLCLAQRRGQLPVECSAVLDLGQDRCVLDRGGAPSQPFAPDLPSQRWASDLARQLAPLRDATPESSSSLPDQIRLVTMLGGTLAADDPAAVAAGWLADQPGSQLRAGLRAVLGATAEGPWAVDLVRDGPHALIAGTTGAGKSELLTTLVTSLAAHHPPDRLAFLLVDYKGGTAFGRLTDLPHVAGLLTDLDAQHSRRALTSLRAELRRRERWLTGTRQPGDLPRLVIVVDEFRVLAEEQPDLLAGLVRVATVGRGLGVHLVLATQRPAGVVSSDIRANVNLRVALRLRDRTDSEDVLDVPDAAALPAGTPGRGLARVGNGPIVTFQAAHLPDDAVRPDAPISVERLPASAPAQATSAPAEATSADAPSGEGDLVRVVRSIQAAARLLGRTPPPPPWLPTLPTMVTLADVLAAAAPSDTVVHYALADLPAEQRRAAHGWDLARDGHLAVIGAPGSGRTTLLRTVAVAAGRLSAHVHALDAGAGLTVLADLPHVGTVVPVHDLERAGRLVRLLTEEVRRRRTAGAAGVTGAAGAVDPHLLLLVDGWESLEETWSRIDHGRGVEDLLRLARDGAGAGLRLAVAGGRALLGGALAAVLSERVLVGSCDPTQALLAGVPADRLPGRLPPGRLLHPGTGSDVVEAQVARAELDTETPAAPGALGPVLRLRALPDHLTLDQLDPVDPGTSAPRIAIVGVGGDLARPLGLPLDGPAGALICAPPGAGRSTALAVLARGVVRGGAPVVLVTNVDSPGAREGRDGDAVVVVTPTGSSGGLLSAVRAALLTERDAVLLLDDGWSAVPGLEDLAMDHLRALGPTDRPRLRVAATATPAETSVAFRGLLAALRECRTGLLLGGRTAVDGEALGVRLPPCPQGPPGRGQLVLRGQAVPVQVATR